MRKISDIDQFLRHLDQYNSNASHAGFVLVPPQKNIGHPEILPG